MSDNNNMEVIVEWDTGMATGFTTRQQAERFIERICRKTAPDLKYCIYSNQKCSSN